MKQPILEYWLVDGLHPQTPRHDDGVNHPAEADQAPNNGDLADSVPRSDDNR
jgi:hypothetical protein